MSRAGSWVHPPPAPIHLSLSLSHPRSTSGEGNNFYQKQSEVPTASAFWAGDVIHLPVDGVSVEIRVGRAIGV